MRRFLFDKIQAYRAIARFLYIRLYFKNRQNNKNNF